jgi:hypothetical protein
MFAIRSLFSSPASYTKVRPSSCNMSVMTEPGQITMLACRGRTVSATLTARASFNGVR